MDRVTDIDLIAITYITDSIGQRVADSETKRTLAGVLDSVSRQEWSDAAQTELRPEFRFYLKDSDDYEGEEIAELNGTRYDIYRTYLTRDGGIDLYLSRRTGVNMNE